MSLFQCENCGCCENTALAPYYSRDMTYLFDWTGIEDREGKALCSACGPSRYSNGTATWYGKWHGKFDRVFLPMGMFRMVKDGNLEHSVTGDQDYRKYAVINGQTKGRECSSVQFDPLVGLESYDMDIADRLHGYAMLHKGMTPESWAMAEGRDEIIGLRQIVSAQRDLIAELERTLKALAAAKAACLSPNAELRPTGAGLSRQVEP